MGSFENKWVDIIWNKNETKFQKNHLPFKFRVLLFKTKIIKGMVPTQVSPPNLYKKNTESPCRLFCCQNYLVQILGNIFKVVIASLGIGLEKWL